MTSWSGRDDGHGELVLEMRMMTTASWRPSRVGRSSPPHLHGDPKQQRSPTLLQGADGGDDGRGGRWGDGWRGTAGGGARPLLRSSRARLLSWSGRGRMAGARAQLWRASPGPAGGGTIPAPSHPLDFEIGPPVEKTCFREGFFAKFKFNGLGRWGAI
jgi:hypothetical protein